MFTISTTIFYHNLASLPYSSLKQKVPWPGCPACVHSKSSEGGWERDYQSWCLCLHHLQMGLSWFCHSSLWPSLSCNLCSSVLLILYSYSEHGTAFRSVLHPWFRSYISYILWSWNWYCLSLLLLEIRGIPPFNTTWVPLWQGILEGLLLEAQLVKEAIIFLQKICSCTDVHVHNRRHRNF